MVDDERMRWLAAQRAAGAEERFPDLVIDRSDVRDVSFLVVGDTGEADASQYAVVEPLLAVGRDTAFMVIASDVIYPAGDVNDYVNGFYIPYADYPGTIYALPGNHDWYALLNGFMYHFCGAEALPRTDYHPLSFPPVERRARRKWRQSSRPNRTLLWHYRRWESTPPQPGPYWALDVGAIRLVAIDIGVGDRIDAEQAAWLERVSRAPRPKILLSGKPLYVNGVYMPGGVAGSDRTIDDVVRDAANRYVAVLAGDVHNYQRYPVDVDGRTIQYVVCGGGGAFMNATHSIGRVDVAGVDEDRFRMYPLRGDSLARYSRVLAPRLRRAVLWLVCAVALALLFAGGIWMEVRPRWLAALLESLPALPGIPLLALLLYLLATYGWIIVAGGAIDPDDAERYVGELLGVEPRRASAANAGEPTFLVRRRLRAMLPAAGRERLLFRGKAFSAFFDFDDPPFFKSFLRIDADEERIRVRCFGVTGWKADESDPPLEDEFEILL